MDNRKLEEPKQVIVMRKDLNMPIGKMIAQGSHASMGILLKDLRNGVDYENYIVPKEDYQLTLNVKKGTALSEWLEKRFTKVVVGVKSETKLKNIMQKAIDKGLPVVSVTDAGFTVFNGVPTMTCIAIGPCFPEDFKGITDKLQLLN